MILHRYIGECCREWILAAGFEIGRCGICNERPIYKREADYCPCDMCGKEEKK